MSDWGATHSQSLVAGLDQEMPAYDYFGQTLIDNVNAGLVSMEDIDNSVSRILTQMFKFNVFDVPNNNLITNDVTNQDHVNTARELTAASHVLLKNEGNVLPLSATKPTKIAIFGQAAVAPIIGGGGSGAVFPKPGSVVTPYQGVLNALGIVDNNPMVPNCNASDVKQDVGIHQWGCESIPGTSAEDCAGKCAAYLNCNFYTYTGQCNLYPTGNEQFPTKGSILGQCTKKWPAPTWQCNAANVCVAFIDGADLDTASALAKEATVAVVAIATFAKEGGDRASLSMAAVDSQDCQLVAPGQDELVSAVAAIVPTVVAMTAGGAALTPWRDDVKAILHGFFPGQEYGNGLADVLFGKVNPSGRLPVTMPTKDNEVEMSRKQYPGIKLEGEYSEKLLVDYRWYNAHKVSMV